MVFDVPYFLHIATAAGAYLPTSLLLCLLAVAAGTALGACFAAAKLGRGGGIALAMRMASVALRGTPLVLLLLLSYFFVPAALGAGAAAFGIAMAADAVPLPVIVVLALALNAAPYLGDALQSARLAVDHGQIEAAMAVGMTRAQALRSIVWPQMWPVFRPALLNTTIGTFKGTSLAYLVSVTDVMNAGVLAASESFRYMEAYGAVALLYWGTCLALEASFARFHLPFEAAARTKAA